ncbi:hypothetical protein [Sphingomonas cavernae]|uniref:Uncharacterized protein n=1 Tax=Sphingomonas cavernae TaxID=2320861 RepID=A0A418WJY4_9SPHN|nr:hypothetical protein [Sphingomonas cavernae]RJF90343.1 hypothetical protein D3876_08785 [Sphingomonas cavernae]
MGRGATLLAAAALVPLGFYAGPAMASRADSATRSTEDCPDRKAQEVEVAKAMKPMISKPKKRRYVLM